MKKYIPNILTFLRGVATLIIVGLFLSNLESKFIAIYILFAFAAASDFFDGYLARKWKVVSELGMIFDPLFDKLLVLSLLLLLFPLDIFPPIIIILLFLRDISIDSMRSFMLSHGTAVPAIKTAKLKTASQMLAINFALLFLILPQQDYLKEIAITLGIVATVFSLWSAGIYCNKFVLFLKKYNSK